MVTRRSHHSSKQYYNNANNHNKHDFFLQLVRMISKESILMVLLGIYSIIAILGAILFNHKLQHHSVVVVADDATVSNQNNLKEIIIIPDIKIFGYNKDEIYNNFYYKIGSNGCIIYTQMTLYDIFLLIPAYIFVFGTLYVHVTRYTYDKITNTNNNNNTLSNHWNYINTTFDYLNMELGYWKADTNVSYIVLPIAIFDIIETYIQRRGCILLLKHDDDEPTRQELSNLQVQIASIAVSMKWSLLGLFFLSIIERLFRVAYCYIKQQQQPSSSFKNHQQRLLPL